MLAARSPARLARTFATVADTAGLKVAAVDGPSRTASVTLLVKAGSRYEPKAGVAHVLKNFAFKSTGKRSALGTVREAELYGGVLSASLTREHLALTADFLRGDEDYFVDVLTSFITSGKFTRHELHEYVGPVTESESTAAVQDPATHAIELAHTIAFRSGLGSSLFAPAHNGITHEDVKAFAKDAFAKGNIALLGAGISQQALSDLAARAALDTLSASPLNTTASRYYGGETRVDSHSGPQTAFIGFGTTGAPSAELSALAGYLATTPAVKWAESHSPLPANVKVVNLPYSDASLFGLLVQGETAKKVSDSAKAAVQAIKQLKFGEQETQKALHKAKFDVASALDTREGFVSYLGSKVLAGADASVESSLSSLDKVTSASLSKAADALFQSKPTYVAVGDIHALPYVDELGL